MALVRDGNIATFEAEYDLAALASHERTELARIKSQVDLARVKAEAVEKRKVRERFLVGLVKVPVLLVLSLGVAVLILAKREVPQQLLDFYNL